MSSDVKTILAELKSKSRPDALKHLAKYGINTDKCYGVSIPDLRKLAKVVGKDHALALELWETGINDARILATMIDIPGKVTKSQMNDWVKDFNSWDVCDQCCNNLFVYTVYSDERAISWSKNKKEFIKRAGFVLMATGAVHDNESGNEKFINYLDIVKREAGDDRNFVKKAVNWALRQIGKRNLELNKIALEYAEEIKSLDSKAAKWVATDAIRELSSEKVIERLKSKK